METQAQPDAPLPPPSARVKRSRKWMWGIWGVGILSVLGGGIVAAPLFVRQRGGPGHELIRAVNHLRQVGLALSDFDYAYGSFPNDSTISILKAEFPGDPTALGMRSSNDYFRQLFVSGIALDEASFHAGFTPGPDGFTGSRALEAGECTFAYVRNVAASDPDTPLAVFPLVKGTFRFDTKLCGRWGDRAAVLFVDNRVITLPVDASGRLIYKGRDLFDPAQVFWHGTSPDVVWPE